MNISFDWVRNRPITERLSTALVLAILVSNSTILVLDHGGLPHLHGLGLLFALVVPIALIGTLSLVWSSRVKSHAIAWPSHVLPIGQFLHGLVDGLMLGTAWHLGLWHGLIAFTALLIHEIPHLWAQHRVWRLGRPHTRRLLIWLVSLTASGLLAGFGLAQVLDVHSLQATGMQHALVWMVALLMIGLGLWIWNHEYAIQPVRQQVCWLLIGLLLAIPLALLHALLHPHAH